MPTARTLMFPRRPLRTWVLATVAGAALLALAVAASSLSLHARDPAVLALAMAAALWLAWVVFEFAFAALPVQRDRALPRNLAGPPPFADTEAGCRISPGSERRRADRPHNNRTLPTPDRAGRAR